MAGTHQIWLIDVARSLHARTPAAEEKHGSTDRQTTRPSLSPLVSAAHDGTLYVADSESNIIRSIHLPPANRVTTIAGGDLFEFGDVDGVGDAVRFQHPLGIALADGRLFVADTYNHRIKVMTPADGRVRTFAGDGRPGHLDGARDTARFYEPAG